jgi:hypothetical protein
MNALYVAWRPPDPVAGWRPVGRLEHDGDAYRFVYTRGARKPGFRPFEGMHNFDAIYESTDLFPVFANRLLSRSRPEFEHYLRWGGFSVESPPDPIVILGVTEGRRQTDAIEVFPCPQPDIDGRYVNRFFLHGIRWMPSAAVARIAALAPQECLFLMPDPQNDFDRNAVAVRTETDRTLVGYIPRYLANDARDLLASEERDSVELRVERVNPDAPLQHRVLCRLTASWPHGFRPCGGEDFEPIPSERMTSVPS